jgi:iron complex transport system substrate-binding protein
MKAPIFRATLGVLAALVGLVLLVSPPSLAARRVVTDSAGRRVEIPERVERVYAAGVPASIVVYALAPDKLLGWNRELTPAERALLPARYAELPAVGRLTGRGNTANVEVVLAARPDIIVDLGTVGPTFVSLADRIQQQTGIPYVLFDGSFSATPRTSEALGEILGVPDQGRRLARYAERVLAEVDERVARVPDEQRPRVYYARGPKGLESGAPGSINTESLARLRARNVVEESVKTTGTVSVSLEQLLAWDPEIIVTVDPTFAASVRTEAAWGGIRAVRAGHVYLAPLVPFPWLDFPPSINRLIGLRWLGRILYPDRFAGDLRQETREFYTMFYHRAPDEAQLDALLGASTRTK